MKLSDDGMRRLAAGILLQAIADIRGEYIDGEPNPEITPEEQRNAIDFLREQGDDYAWLAEIEGFFAP